jgi:hypothetical protein
MKITMMVRMDSPAGTFVRQLELEQSDDKPEMLILSLANQLWKATDFTKKEEL